MMPISHKPRQIPDYRLEEIDGELLLYHPDRAKIMYCNPSASLIWQLCDGQRTVAEMIALLSAAYGQPDLADDVTATLDLFHQHGAIEYEA
jgi:hypothetical protein